MTGNGPGRSARPRWRRADGEAAARAMPTPRAVRAGTPARMGRAVALLGLAAALLGGAAAAHAQDAVFLEDLTWTEVRDALRAGKTAAIVPTGGTEQNGPHMVLGKHNVIARHAAGEIARRLGTALVAPVLAYAPEGAIAPPTGHMWAPGTLTLPAELFAKVVEFAARSLKAHGFLDIALLGDSGPNQAPLAEVARRLNREWAAGAARVHHLSAYYDDRAFVAWLQARGETGRDIGAHAGLADTSRLLAVHPPGVRRDRLAPGRPGDGSGVGGDPTRASAAYGAAGLELQVAAAVRQFHELRARARGRP